MTRAARSRGPRGPALVALLVALPGMLPGVLPAQDDAARFDAAVASMRQAAEPSARQQAAATALELFLRLPGPAAASRRPAAVVAAQLAGDHRRALQLAEEVRRLGEVGPALVQAQLLSLAALGEWQPLIEQARQDEAHGHGDAVAAAVLATEATALPAADALLRGGSTDAGLWLLGAIARAVPGDGVRAANLALGLARVGNLHGAEQVYRQALALAPEDEQTWNDYGLFLRATGRTAAALEAFARSRAVERVPGSGPAVTNLMVWEVLTPGSIAPDPLPLAMTALALRPDAALLRRATIDLLLQRADQHADRQADKQQQNP